MTKQKATFEIPSYVPHTPHDSWNGSEMVPVSVGYPLSSATKWYMVYFDWTGTGFVEPSSHYLIDVSYKIKSAGSSISSSASSTLSLETNPKYDVYYRFCTTSTPNQVVDNNSNWEWIFLTTTSNTKIQPQRYTDRLDYTKIQFVVCGRDNDSKPHFVGDTSENVTGDYVNGKWIRNPRDSQVLFVSNLVSTYQP